MKKEHINIASPPLPTLDEYNSLLKEIWDSRILTNNGPIVLRFKEELKNFLNIDSEIILTNNGTSALEVAISALGEFDHYYTTPFSFIATLSSLKWLGKEDIRFIDIDENSFNVSPTMLKEMYNPSKKSLSLFTHVFGNSCEVEMIEEIINQNKKSKIIYDAAHSFNSKLNDKSIFDYGDLATTSFHATKIFHSIEGGAIFCKDKGLAKKIESLINFGYSKTGEVQYIGTNAKLSEFHAAMGLLNLKKFQETQKKYTQNFRYLKENLSPQVKFQKLKDNQDWNHSYCPIVLPNTEVRRKAIAELKEANIIPREYFNPSLNKLFNNSSSCTISENLCKRILCIPCHRNIQKRDMNLIISIINNLF